MTPTNTASTIALRVAGAILGLAVLAGAVYYVTPGAAKEAYAAIPVTRMDLIAAVTATGQTAPDQKSVLAFDGSGGTIAAVNVAVGDQVTEGEVLATLETDILQSSLEGAQANVAAAQAQLATLQEGAKPADVAVYTQKAADAETALANDIHDAYTKTEDAIGTQIDPLFANSSSIIPVIDVQTPSVALHNQIDQERVTVSNDLSAWQSALQSDTPTQVTAQAQSEASTTLSDATQLMSDLNTTMNYLLASNSGLSTTQIDADRDAVNAASAEVSAAESEYSGGISGVAEAGSALALETSSATPSALAAQDAQIAQAQAQVDADQSLIDHAELVAPFDGTVTDVEATKGEVFAISAPVITVISGGPLKIDIQVPETDVGSLAPGDAATVTLDTTAGSGMQFPATITTIDPGETSLNGINSYQVTLHFLNADPRILSGMTANVSIVTASTSDVVAVPASDIITKGAQTSVLLRTSNGQFAEQPVTTGVTGTNGYVEITSGLSEGDQIASL